jgi:hypothetical protein
VSFTFIGSDQLVWFDAALVGYLSGTIFAVFGVVYRCAAWVRRPPTAMSVLEVRTAGTTDRVSSAVVV